MKSDTSNDAIVPPLALTIPETTRVLSTSRSAIYRYLKAGRLHAIKVGIKTLIPVDSAREFIASCRSYKAPQPTSGRRRTAHPPPANRAEDLTLP